MGIDDLFYETGIDFIDEHPLHFIKGSFSTIYWKNHKPTVLLNKLAEKAIGRGLKVAYVMTINEPESVLRNAEIFGYEGLNSDSCSFYRLKPGIERDVKEFSSLDGNSGFEDFKKEHFDVIIVEELLPLLGDMSQMSSSRTVLGKLKNYAEVNGSSCFSAYMFEGQAGISQANPLSAITSASLLSDNELIFMNLGADNLQWVCGPELDEDEEVDVKLLLPIFELRALTMEYPDYNPGPITITCAPHMFEKVREDYSIYTPIRTGDDGPNLPQQVVIQVSSDDLKMPEPEEDKELDD